VGRPTLPHDLGRHARKIHRAGTRRYGCRRPCNNRTRHDRARPGQLRGCCACPQGPLPSFHCLTNGTPPGGGNAFEPCSLGSTGAHYSPSPTQRDGLAVTRALTFTPINTEAPKARGRVGRVRVPLLQGGGAQSGKTLVSSTPYRPSQKTPARLGSGIGAPWHNTDPLNRRDAAGPWQRSASSSWPASRQLHSIAVSAPAMLRVRPHRVCLVRVGGPRFDRAVRIAVACVPVAQPMETAFTSLTGEAQGPNTAVCEWGACTRFAMSESFGLELGSTKLGFCFATTFVGATRSWA